MKTKILRRTICCVLCAMMVLSLAACGGSGGQVQTDHNIPSDLTDTTTGGDGSNLPPDYNQLEGSQTGNSAGEPSANPSDDPAAQQGDASELPAEPSGTQPADGQSDGTDLTGQPEIPVETDQGRDQTGQDRDQTGQDGTQPPAGETETPPAQTGPEVVQPAVTMSIPQEADVVVELSNLSHEVPLSQGLTTSAPRIEYKSNEYAVIDYSNTKDGYVTASYTAQTDKRIKCIVKGPSTSYNYNLTPTIEAVLPLSDGNGTYTITVYQNVQGTKYASVLTVTLNVVMSNEFAPFLRSNQYVDFASAPNSVLKAASICAGASDPLVKVSLIYDYVVGNIKYDTEKARTVQSGYLPVLDTVLSTNKGICFDYAALMTGMLRSQGVPCKLVVGYAGTAYHAWISVWSDEQGWVEGFVYFDGITWQRMDPTFDSNGAGSDAIRQYIGNGANYTVKYLY